MCKGKCFLFTKKTNWKMSGSSKGYFRTLRNVDVYFLPYVSFLLSPISSKQNIVIYSINGTRIFLIRTQNGIVIER